MITHNPYNSNTGLSLIIITIMACGYSLILNLQINYIYLDYYYMKKKKDLYTKLKSIYIIMTNNIFK